jgi:HEAT repeat protein
MLSSDDEGDKLAATRLLVAGGHSDVAIPVLLDLLHSDRDYIQSRAADQLWNAGQWERAVPILLDFLTSEQAEVRVRTARLLAGRGPETQMKSALLALLQSESEDIRYSTARLLLESAHCESAECVLLDLLENGTGWARSQAAGWLLENGYGESVKPILLARAQAEREQLMENQASATPDACKPIIRQLVTTAEILISYGLLEEAVPALLDLLQFGKRRARSIAIKNLLRSSEREQAIAELTAQLQSEFEDERMVAAKRLMEGGNPHLATPTLRSLLQAESMSTRLVASGLLMRDKEHSEAAARVRIDALQTGDAEVRRHVMNGFWNMPLAGPHLLSSLEDLPDPAGLWERALAKPPQLTREESQLLADLTSIKPEDSEGTWFTRGALLTALWWAHNRPTEKN